MVHFSHFDSSKGVFLNILVYLSVFLIYCKFLRVK